MTSITRLNESPDYVAAREKLEQAELELMQHRERVAEMRRALPLGPVVNDYVFMEGPRSLADGDTPAREVRLSELFTAPGRPLVIYHLMYGKAQTTACPMCTQWIDGFNGIAAHLTQNVDFAVVAAADLKVLRAHARNREWNRLCVLSAAANTFKYDLNSEDEDGAQDSTVSVFVKDADGNVRHTYTSHPWFDDHVRERGIDLLCPTWHFLDLTPRGRGDWYSSLDYGVNP
jgi:predicted dithiol-disulfide oxidoreductase (DUF899 family)